MLEQLPVTLTPGALTTVVRPSGWSFDSGPGTLTLSIPTVTWGAAVAIDGSLGNWWRITATTSVAYTVGIPSGLILNTMYLLTVRNTSGGALGAATFNAIFKMATWVNPANATSRTVVFMYDGTNLVEVSRTPADVPN